MSELKLYNAFGIRLLLKLGHILELKVERFNTKRISSIYIEDRAYR